MMDQEEDLRQQLKSAQTALEKNATAENLARIRYIQARLPSPRRPDIVTRLRKVNPNAPRELALRNPDGPEAADDIERLRAVLLEIVEECRNTGYGDPTVMERMIDRIEETACAALEWEKKDD